MRALIVTIGDEILIGQTIDTNSAWIAQELELIGVSVDRILSIHDTEEDILEGIDLGFQKFDLTILTGGLGPTKDDLTKITIAKYFNVDLEYRDELFQMVKSHFDNLGYPMPDTNNGQAYVPSNCRHFLNHKGTAAGMWFEKNNKVLISMPGVPYEMKGLMSNGIIEAIKKHFNAPPIGHALVMTQGIGESSIMKLIEDIEDDILAAGLSLAYLPSPGQVKLRISGYERKVPNFQQKLFEFKNSLADRLSKYVFGFDGISIEEAIYQLFAANEYTLASAESCTGGFIAHKITSVPGSSAFFKGSIVAYDNSIKINQLNVLPIDVDTFGAVSKVVVEQMAANVRTTFKTDFAVATSGIAGPSGGTALKPVGTVWIAIASKSKVYSKRFFFGPNRERNILVATLTAMTFLRKIVLKEEENFEK